MTEATRDLLKRALELPAEERARLARELLHSLDAAEAEEAPEKVAEAWREELARRHARARAGEPATDWRVALERIRSGLAP